MRGEDGERPMLSWSALSDLAQDGFEIGSHGRRHLAADVNPSALVRRDARASRIELEDRLGREVLSFAYPFGYHAASGRCAVREAGFAQACAVGDLAARADDDRWALPRLQVRGGTTAEALLAMVRRRPSWVARSWTHAKQSTWRTGRRWGGWGPSEARRVSGVPVAAPGPTRVAMINVADPLGDLDCTRDDTPPYEGAWILACRSGRPLGIVELPLHGTWIRAAKSNGSSAGKLGKAWSRELPADAPQLVRASVVIPTALSRPEQLRRCVRRLTKDSTTPTMSW